MRKIILLLALFFLWALSSPNVDKFAQIISKTGGSGYIDSEGKLWILGTKWKTEKVEQREGPFYVIKNGKIDTIPARPGRSWEHRLYPYLYFRLYNKDGEKINEGIVQDSVETGERLMVLSKVGYALITAFVRTDIGIRQADPPAGYICLILLDKSGNIVQKQQLEQSDLTSILLHRYVIDYDWNIVGAFSNLTIPDLVKQHFVIESSQLKVPPPSFGVRNTVISKFLKGNVQFSCQKVDTFRIVGEKGDMNARMEDYKFFQDSIQVLNYNFDTQQWQIKRYHLPSASFRKFENFDLYPLENYPNKLIQDEPIYESVRLNNDYIVVTVFMKENNEPVAYQMLFDSLGNYLKPDKIEILKPRDIKKIPDGSKMYIKSFAVSDSWSKGKYRKVDVYIWGYDLEEGMLYWKKYRVNTD